MLVFFALALVVLLGFCGLAVDVGMLQLKQLQMQNAADAAALAASYTLGSGGITQATWDAAKADAGLDGFTDGQNGVLGPKPVQPATGTYAGNALAVQVTVQQTVNPVFFSGVRTVSAQSVALAPSSTACSYFLSQYATDSSIVDSQAQISAASGTCDVYLGAPYSFQEATSSGVHYLLPGSDAGTLSLSTVTPAATTNAVRMADPLISLPPPPFSPTCTHSGLFSVNVASKATLQPGTYCGGIEVNSSSNVTFKPGTYAIAGNLKISTSTVIGSQVLFYMTSLPGYPAGTISLNGTATLSAPSLPGPLQGILFYSDRSLPSGKQTNSVMLTATQLNGSGGTLDGITYLPGQEVSFMQSYLKGVQCFGIVADWINLVQGQVTFSSDYSALGGSPFSPTGRSLVQ